MKKHTWILLAVYAIPRFLLLYILLFAPSISQNLATSSREPINGAQGQWVILAHHIAAGEKFLTADDLGMSYLMAGLYKLGFPMVGSFYMACVLWMLIGALIVVALYRSSLFPNSRFSFWALLLLSLYPPAIYMTFINVTRIFALYGYLLALVVLLYSDRLFEGPISGKKLVLYIGLAFTLMYLVFLRNSNLPILLACLLGVIWRLLRHRKNLLAGVVFAALALGAHGLRVKMVPNSGHAVWHNMYMFLSDFDHKYGFKACDDFSRGVALAINPNLQNSTYSNVEENPEYELLLKHLYFDAVKRDPVWYVEKMALRTIKMIIFPYQGSWLIALDDKSALNQGTFRELASGWSQAAGRLYITFGTLTAGIDMLLVFLGFLGLVVYIRSVGLLNSLPYLLLIASVSHIYILVGVGNHSLYLTGTMIYIFYSFYFMQVLWKKLPPRGIEPRFPD